MKFKKYEVEDFLADRNFINWVSNPGAESDKYWHSVLDSYPEKRDVIEKAIKLLRSIHFKKVSVSDDRKDRILRKTIELAYSDRSTSIKKSTKRIGGVKFLQIAAIVFIFFSAGAFLTFQFSGWENISSASSADKVEIVTKQNPVGRKSRFYLPDGSHVTLNADSKIDYNTNFSEKREVWLSGEASFEVKKDLGNNFLVHTENLTIMVKGTSFNISAFPGELHESISLLSGKVDVSCTNDTAAEAYALIPGEKLRVDLLSNKPTISELNMDEVLWSSGILVFKNDDLETFKKKIHRWYGVSTVVSGAPKVKINITGKFDNESLTNVLEGLKFSLGMDYSFDNNIVSLQF